LSLILFSKWFQFDFGQKTMIRFAELESIQQRNMLMAAQWHTVHVVIRRLMMYPPPIASLLSNFQDAIAPENIA